MEERIITGVEVETEGERWVYDINYEYGEDTISPDIETPTNKGKGIKMRNLPSWEEGDEGEQDGRGRRGEWRRRRWVRMVKRKWSPGTSPKATR